MKRLKDYDDSSSGPMKYRNTSADVPLYAPVETPLGENTNFQAGVAIEIEGWFNSDVENKGDFVLVHNERGRIDFLEYHYGYKNAY